MLLRKLVVVLGPLLLALLLCALFRFLDGLLGSGNFWLFALKGLLLGAGIGLVLPLAGISTQHRGLTGWLFGAAGVLFLLLAYQWAETIGLVRWPVMKALFSLSGQAALVESALLGFALLTGAASRFFLKK